MGEKQKVTIYCRGFIGIRTIEATLVAHGRKPFAQYPAAPYVHFIPKGKRTIKGITDGYHPFFVIVEGWNQPQAPDGMVTQPIGTDGLIIKQSKYASCDERYDLEFNEWLSQQNVNVIADYRKKEAA